MRDEDFDLFIEEFGEPCQVWEVSQKDLIFWKDKLPDQLLKYWQNEGFCSFGDGLIDIVNPSYLATTVKEWIANTSISTIDNFHGFAKTAFGNLYVCGEKTGAVLTINCQSNTIIATATNLKEKKMDLRDRSIRAFFGASFKSDFDRLDTSKNNLFNQACKKLGKLNFDEIYAFSPALVLGGMPCLNNLKKFKLIEHLSALKQVAAAKVIY